MRKFRWSRGQRVRDLRESRDLRDRVVPGLAGRKQRGRVRAPGTALILRDGDVHVGTEDGVDHPPRRLDRVLLREQLRVASFIDWLCEHWDQPDEGIWETRGGRQDFVYGRVQTWVALDRAIKMATSRARPADVNRWITERNAVYNEVFSKGWNPKSGAFTQHYGSDVLDSALLDHGAGVMPKPVN